MNTVPADGLAPSGTRTSEGMVMTKFRSCKFTGPYFVGPIISEQRLISWWRYEMEHFPRYWPFVRRTTVTGGFSSQRASDTELWCFLGVRLNRRLNKQWKCRWFETQWRSSWRHCNDWHQIGRGRQQQYDNCPDWNMTLAVFFSRKYVNCKNRQLFQNKNF